MQQIDLVQGAQSTRVSREGPSLHVVNAPPPSDVSDTARPTAVGHILLGFDHDPTVSNFDAHVAPYTDTVIEVPGSVVDVFFAFPAATQPFAAKEASAGSSTPIRIAVEWVGCPVEPGLRPFRPVLPIRKVNQTFGLANDRLGDVLPPGLGSPVYDQVVFGSSIGRHFRPRIAPSVADTIHVVTAAATLFNFTGGAAFLFPPGNGRVLVLHRIYVSVSVACLFVVGGQGLTVGSPGNEELGRLAFPAAGIQVIDFGPDGIELNDMSFTAGAFRAYTSVIATVDATVIGG